MNLLSAVERAIRNVAMLLAARVAPELEALFG